MEENSNFAYRIYQFIGGLFGLGIIVLICLHSFDFSNSEGTYELTDKLGQSFVLTLEDDETGKATIQGEVYYCSWKFRKTPLKPFSGYLELRFSPNKNNALPTLVFEGGTGDIGFACIRDGWLYYDHSALEAKNPSLRLSIKKVK